LGSPKTGRGRRIHLPPVAVAALRRHRVRQNEERLVLGEAWPAHDFIFCTVIGEPIRGTHLLERHFLPTLKRAGLPVIRWHDLRHTAATLLLLQNVPAKVVSEMLGHSTVPMTLDVYSHVLPSMQESAAAAMERALGGLTAI
ncbi:MAG: site-specific integrase, partial [Ktedonobacterales bacterium]